MAPRRGRQIGTAAAFAVLVLISAVLAGRAGTPGAAGATASAHASAPPPASTPPSTSTGPTTPVTTAGPTSAPTVAAVLPAGFTLHAAAAARPAAAATPIVSGRPLTPADITQIVHRLPAWSTSGLTTSFAWPTATLTRPAAGTTVTQTFPGAGTSQNPPTTPSPTSTGPLQVLRMQPEGEVSIAPFVSITFNQPMVAVAPVGQLAADRVPATITPAVAGHWEWLGTSTLRFSADSATVDRLPMATRFTVTVPAGTTSAAGAVLARAATATFSTPPPAVLSFVPRSDTPVTTHPVLVAVFNQRMDPATVLRTVAVTADGQNWPVRSATAAEVAADPTAAAAVSAAPDGRVVAFVATRSFPTGTEVDVAVQAGTRSAEGTLTSASAASFAFHTYQPMTFAFGSCSESQCRPGGPIALRFSNQIDTDSFDPTTVTVSPAVPGGSSVSAGGNEIYVSGATQASTTYRVSVKAGLRDVFGQTLTTPADATVDVGAYEPQIQPFATPVSTLDPTVAGSGIRVITVGHTKFRERVFAVADQDWTAYAGWWSRLQRAGENYRPGADLHVPDWTVLTDRTVSVSGDGRSAAATALGLKDDLTDGRTQLVVLVEPIDSVPDAQTWQNLPTATWVQSTTLAVDGISDQSGLRAWVTDLRTGQPIAGAKVALLDASGRPIGTGLTTDAAGLAETDLPAQGATALRATAGNQTALLPGNMWGQTWAPYPAQDRLLWFVTDDRQTYRPGETVSVKGWVRRQADDAGTALSVPASGTLTWTATDAYGSRLGSGRATVDRAGGFDLSLELPAGSHLGPADLRLDLSGESGTDDAATDHGFTVADFRTPAFEVDTHAATGDPAVRGSDVTVQTDATYYAGGPLGQAPVDWQVRTAAATYSPPGWTAFTFGVWTPWWYDDNRATGAMVGPAQPCCTDPSTADAKVHRFTGTTDGTGAADLAVTVGDLGKDTDGLPVDIVAQATVTDVNRQQIAGTAEILVHPADDYVGLATDSTFVESGKPLTVRAVATAVDGTVAAGRPITVTAARVAGGWSAGQSTETLVDPHTCTVISGAVPVSCTFTPTVGGEYRVTAVVTDEHGRTSRTQLTRWVAGSDGQVATNVAEQSVTIIPDQQQYQPGQSAHLLVASPISTGTGLLTVTHNGFVSTTTFRVADGSAQVAVPISAALAPGAGISVEVVGTAPAAAELGGGQRPAYATGQIDLSVSRQSRALTVTVRPRQSTVTPGGHTTVDVTVTDPAGKPVPDSQFEVTVVDEGVLALAGDQTPDPLAAFYPDDRQTYLNAQYGRSTVVLGVATPTTGNGAVPGMTSAAMSSAAGSAAAVPSAASSASGSSATRDAAAVAGQASTPIVTRSVFAALALFRPTVVTDAQGTASIPVTLPDNLTRYRVQVIAVAGENLFGTGASEITGGLPLTVRPSAPRFLNFGDQAELPVVVQNLTAAPRTTDVVLQTANLTITGSAGREVTVPAHGRVEVRFPVRADQAGTARFRVAAVSGSDADAAQVDLPVYTPSTSETFATYGTLAGGTTVGQKLTKPTDVIPAFGGLQITTSSTALAQLSDALAYVADDDYTSSDALAARITGISSLAEVLRAFAAPGLPSPDALKARVASDISKLLERQNKDGGFASWEAGQESDPFLSVQAGQALALAEQHALTGSNHSAVVAALKALLPYLTGVDGALPADTSQQVRDTVDAYAIAVRALAGDGSAAAAADDLAGHRGAALPLDATAWLLPVVTAAQRPALLTRIGNAAVDDAGSVTFTSAVADDSWTTLQSDTRTDALVLDALLTVDPTSDLIAKTVRGLFGQQRGGRWNNLQENVFGLVAARHYFDVDEADTPDFTAGVWLGNRLAGQHSYAGRTTEQTQLDIPTSEVVAAGDTTITLSDQGSGRMYYRIGLTTAPVDLTVSALDRGFVVTRTYAGADDPADVTRDAAGVWHVKAGARVRVTVTLVSRSARNQVVLADPLPAGLEGLNPALATTPQDLAGTNRAGGNADPLTWSPTWFDHQELRDDRAQAFATWLQGGVYTYSYLAAATTPGTFVVPPATAAQIYAPETFGRTATDRVVIGD